MLAPISIMSLGTVATSANRTWFSITTLSAAYGFVRCLAYLVASYFYQQAVVIERHFGSAYISRTERDGRLVHQLTIQDAHGRIAWGGVSLLFLNTDGNVRIGLSQSAHVGWKRLFILLLDPNALQVLNKL